MSADVVNLQAQVEAVLGPLVKAATVELIKLFEGRFRANARGPDATQCADGEETFEVTNSLSTEGTKRSVGVQVDLQDTYGMLALPVFPPSCCAGTGIRAGSLPSCTSVQLHARRWFVCIRSREELRNARPFKSFPPLPAGLPVPPLDRDGLKDHREQQQGAAAHHSQVGSARTQQVGVNLWGGGAKVAEFTAGEQTCRFALCHVFFLLSHCGADCRCGAVAIV